MSNKMTRCSGVKKRSRKLKGFGHSTATDQDILGFWFDALLA